MLNEVKHLTRLSREILRSLPIAQGKLFPLRGAGRNRLALLQDDGHQNDGHQNDGMGIIVFGPRTEGDILSPSGYTLAHGGTDV